MGLQTSLFQALSGLTSSSHSISVSGNNIANVNTTAFKSSRATFETQIAQTLQSGSLPTATLGGTNPGQVGLGTRLAAISRNFNDGSLQPTGVNTDLAIEGSGFFVVDLNGSTRFTRAGTFSLDRDKNLVNPDGGLVQGFGVDGLFNVVQGVQQSVNIPIGTLTIAEPTTAVSFSGNLNANGAIATTGSVISSNQLFSDAAATINATTADLLTNIRDAAGPAMFAANDVITVSGARKGGATIPNHTFEVSATNTTGSDDFGTTLQDFMDFLDDILGIDSTVPSVPTPGITLAGGIMTITGNNGTENDLILDRNHIIINAATAPTTPFNTTKTVTADGESVRTTFIVIDSLGTPRTVDLTAVLETKTTNGGTTWRFYAQAEDDSDLDRVLGNGLMNFDTNGNFINSTNGTINLDLANTGASTPQQIVMDFVNPGGSSGAVSALTDKLSQLNADRRDGTEIGTLEDFSISSDGTIVGTFSNGQLRNLGQIVLATFSNPQGLVDLGGNLFNISSNSGNANISIPGSGRAGRIVGSSLELSNVDLSEEFINLITASTGFSANSRVLSTSDQLIQELLATAR